MKKKKKKKRIELSDAKETKGLALQRVLQMFTPLHSETYTN